MKETRNALLLIGLLLFGCSTASKENYQSDPSTWTEPRYIYNTGQAGLVVFQIEKVDNSAVQELKEKNYSEGNVYYFLEKIGRENSLVIFADKEKSLRITVPRYKHRPLRGKWINSKLLYVDVTFNPHYGAYIIYDVENDEIVIKEYFNDGVDTWNQFKQGNTRRVKLQKQDK